MLEFSTKTFIIRDMVKVELRDELDLEQALRPRKRIVPDVDELLTPLVSSGLCVLCAADVAVPEGILCRFCADDLGINPED